MYLEVTRVKVHWIKKVLFLLNKQFLTTTRADAKKNIGTKKKLLIKLGNTVSYIQVFLHKLVLFEVNYL